MDWDDDFGLPIYDRQGRRIGYAEWIRLKFEDPEYYRIDSTHVGPYWVSTVWLGTDHNFLYGAPIIFETMIFDESGDPAELHGLDLHTQRYGSEDQARAGHDQIVAMLKEHYAKRATTVSPERIEAATEQAQPAEEQIFHPDHC